MTDVVYICVCLSHTPALHLCALTCSSHERDAPHNIQAFLTANTQHSSYWPDDYWTLTVSHEKNKKTKHNLVKSFSYLLYAHWCLRWLVLNCICEGFLLNGRSLCELYLSESLNLTNLWKTLTAEHRRKIRSNSVKGFMSLMKKDKFNSSSID